MSRYVRLTKGLADKGILVSPDSVADYLSKDDRERYTSTYYYNKNHLEQFKKTGTVKGIKDVTTDKLWFDFDDEVNPNNAKLDALALIDKLTLYKIDKKNIEIYFSGNRGFHIVVTINKFISPETVKNIVINKFSKGLKSLDLSLYDCSQILRIPGSIHGDTNLYKIPLTYEELQNLSLEEIKNKAQSLNNLTEEYNWESASPSEDFFEVPAQEEKKTPVKSDYTLDLTKKPREWKNNCKWSLLQGNFKKGERHTALTVLAATCKGIGYDKETSYSMCKSALYKSHERYGEGDCNKEELWNNVIESVFSDHWEGGQYSCKSDPWLHVYCESLGDDRCKIEEENKPSVTLNEVKNRFLIFSKDFEKNKIKTGIHELDRNVTFCTSTLNGILANPGAGKTSLSLQVLKNASKENIPSMFFSLDMGEPIVYTKLLQNHLSCSFDDVLNYFREDPQTAVVDAEEVNELYKNVAFNFKSALTVNDIRNSILEQNRINGVERKVKLVVIDYLETIGGELSDATANAGSNALKLKDVANDLEVCIVLLLQTQKHSTPNVSDPLLSLKNVKGSSLIEQSCSVIMTLWREGYDPRYTEYDRYISFASVKNRFGGLWQGDFKWDGMRGQITSLTVEELNHLENFRELKTKDKIEAAQNSLNL